MFQLKLPFGPGYPVKITEADIPARVCKITIDENGAVYEVEWWVKGSRHTSTLFASVLAADTIAPKRLEQR